MLWCFLGTLSWVSRGGKSRPGEQGLCQVFSMSWEEGRDLS